MDLAGLLEWHVDNHIVTFRLDQSEIKMFPGECPVLIDGPCRFAPRGECAVNYFVSMYGIDLNVGSVIIDQEWIEIAWTFQGDLHDLGAAQMWIIPREDSSFGSFLATYGDESS